LTKSFNIFFYWNKFNYFYYFFEKFVENKGNRWKTRIYIVGGKIIIYNYLLKNIYDNSKKVKYIDITQEWLSNVTPNSHEIKDCLNYNHNGVTYKVDGKYVVLDYSKKELEVANFLKETFGE